MRHAIHYGLSPVIAIQCATINPARHMRIEQWVGSISPGRYADIVLLADVATIDIAHVYADGQLVSDGKTYVGPEIRIDWPDWARSTIMWDAGWQRMILRRRARRPGPRAGRRAAAVPLE